MTKDMLDKLSAYLDGELDDMARTEIELALEKDTDLQAMLETISSADNSLRPAYAATLNAPIPDRLSKILTEPEKTSLPDWAGMIRSLLRPDILAGATAALVIGLVAGSSFTTTNTPSAEGFIMAETGEIIAGQSLATILTTARSGEIVQADGHDFMIRLSFKTDDGKYCREFRNQASVGIACSNTQGWKIETIGPNLSPPSDRFAMVGEAPSEISAAITRLGVAEVLDIDGETTAIHDIWK